MNKLLTGRFFLSAFALSFATVFTVGQLLPRRTAVEISDLQGHWEGQGSGGKCSITITNNVLHYRAGTNWWKTTFTLPPATNPQQLHATIKDSSPPTNGIGEVVSAIIKIEDATLTVATYAPAAEPPRTFADTEETSLYVLKKVPLQKKTAEILQ